MLERLRQGRMLRAAGPAGAGRAKLVSPVSQSPRVLRGTASQVSSGPTGPASLLSLQAILPPSCTPRDSVCTSEDHSL